MSDGSSSKIGRFSENALKTTPVNLLALSGIAYTLADTFTRWRLETVYCHFWGVVGALLFGIMPHQETPPPCPTRRPTPLPHQETDAKYLCI